ncbi:hypothetical protein BST81_25800 [Leptolyngbya sp. 'hensonii']|uniref:DUF3134 family protein n=1 Tax=Leptolyngbya sp. 'hensonii' TaxID=1922337 RepID=UPI00094F6672|nr:DUF3134 family protein [Leptolyngbya sp. 'hensonii']OLP15520.1 hypothetical protein BST81_25800 [Leptolyngbya sp. 'hensonii']
MTTCHNPALSEEPRNKPIRIVPPIARESLLNWLESTGRFKASENDEFLQNHKIPEELDDILDSEIYVLDSEEEESD